MISFATRKSGRCLATIGQQPAQREEATRKFLRFLEEWRVLFSFDGATA